jgi:2-polyprenyl-3-methyl-5-hydroxy-6-metoxy-1,4-benzoquinol methylase
MLNNIVSSTLKGDIVADIGCGDLMLSKQLAKKGASIWAYDKYKQFENDEVDIKFFQINLNEEPLYLPKEYFNKILLINILQFVKNEVVLNELLPNVINALKTEGKIYIQTFTSLPKNESMQFKNVISFYNIKDFNLAGIQMEYQKEGIKCIVTDKGETTFFYTDVILIKR